MTTQRNRRIRKIRAGVYETRDGAYRIEREDDGGSLNEYDKPDDPLWYVYTLPVRNGYGPPEAVADRETLRECKTYVEEN